MSWADRKLEQYKERIQICSERQDDYTELKKHIPAGVSTTSWDVWSQSNLDHLQDLESVVDEVQNGSHVGCEEAISAALNTIHPFIARYDELEFGLYRVDRIDTVGTDYLIIEQIGERGNLFRMARIHGCEEHQLSVQSHQRGFIAELHEAVLQFILKPVHLPQR